MIQINSLKLPCGHSKEELEEKICKQLKISRSHLKSWKILRQSIDARKKPELFFVYLIEAEVDNERTIVKKLHNPSIVIASGQTYTFPKEGVLQQKHRPVIIGTGPAGLFCAWYLARAGYCPLVLERGEMASKRKETVDHFWKDGVLNPDSNVQFGEGGAGTFSDGKLNTLVKDPSGRNKEVLKILAQVGADPTITYVNKPHVGTDVLRTVVKNIRSEIESLGGEVRFGCRLEDFETQNGHLCSIRVSARKGTSEAGRTVEEIPASALVLAIGHSARDTFAMLAEKPLDMQAKAFAVGLRIQHPQTQINLIFISFALFIESNTIVYLVSSNTYVLRGFLSAIRETSFRSHLLNRHSQVYALHSPKVFPPQLWLYLYQIKSHRLSCHSFHHC